ncbi:MAG: gfo/Idh/MocA family oxidoreductase, partial [Bryobacteraceae bacterium]
MRPTRRDVFRSAVAVSAASYQRVQGANDKVNLGVIGVGTRGSGVMNTFQGNPQVSVKAICDVYGDRRDRALSK